VDDRRKDTRQRPAAAVGRRKEWRKDRRMDGKERRTEGSEGSEDSVLDTGNEMEG
jgi:hypothetical protein